jgi:hypothetical protein
MNEVQQADADASNTARLQSNASVSEFAKFREQQLLGREQGEEPQAQEEVVEDVAEETQEVSEAQVENEQEQAEVSEETEADVLSNIDLDTMSEEELTELSEKLGSRAVARFGELTAKRKQAEAELASLRSKLENADDPLTPTVDQSTNPYRNVKEISELQKIAQDLDNVVEWAEDLIFNSDGYSAEDVVTTVNGKEYTKAEVRKQLTNARKNQKKYLPAQLKIIQTRVQAAEAKSSLIDQAKSEFGWIGKEDSDLNQKYQAMLDDPRLEGLEEFSPELAAQLPYLLAHSANSLYGRKIINNNNEQQTTSARKNVQLDPPASAPGSAKSEKQISSSLKAFEAQQKAFRETGTKDDFIKMRTMRYSQQ